MKVTLVLLGLVSLSLAAPQPRKLFHEHVEDFLSLIGQEVGEELEQLMNAYLQFEEFQATFEYLRTNDFKNLVVELESLPEFNAVVDFLEADKIDIHYFINIINEMIGAYDRKKQISRVEISGTDFSSYIRDAIEIFPQEKLAALFEQKIGEDEEFSSAMNNLRGEEWSQIFDALWESETFIKEVHILDEAGINAHLLITEILAVFGISNEHHEDHDHLK